MFILLFTHADEFCMLLQIRHPSNNNNRSCPLLLLLVLLLQQQYRDQKTNEQAIGITAFLQWSTAGWLAADGCHITPRRSCSAPPPSKLTHPPCHIHHSKRALRLNIVQMTNHGQRSNWCAPARRVLLQLSLSLVVQLIDTSLISARTPLCDYQLKNHFDASQEFNRCYLSIDENKYKSILH